MALSWGHSWTPLLWEIWSGMSRKCCGMGRTRGAQPFPATGMAPKPPRDGKLMENRENRPPKIHQRAEGCCLGVATGVAVLAPSSGAPGCPQHGTPSPCQENSPKEFPCPRCQPGAGMSRSCDGKGLKIPGKVVLGGLEGQGHQAALGQHWVHSQPFRSAGKILHSSPKHPLT